MKGENKKMRIKDAEIKKECLVIPIYYFKDDLGIINIDLNTIQEEYEKVLNEVVLNPQAYIK